MPNARDELCGVGFNLHATAAPVAALTALEFAVHIVKIHSQARGQSLKDRNQALPMRLSGGLETQHVSHSDAGVARHPNFGILTNSARTVKILPPSHSKIAAKCNSLVGL